MSQQRSPEAHELTLSRREIRSTFVDMRVESSIHRLNVFLESTLLQHSPEIAVGSSTRRIDIFSEGSCVDSATSVTENQRERHDVPSKHCESCGMMLSDDRSRRNPIVDTSTPSMTTVPDSGSTTRYSTIVKLDFPAPVRPQTPTFSPPLTSKLTSRSTRSRFARYRAETPWYERDPSAGQLAAGSVALISVAASGLSSMYSWIRSTETMLVSTSVADRTIQLRVCSPIASVHFSLERKQGTHLSRRECIREHKSDESGIDSPRTDESEDG